MRSFSLQSLAGFVASAICVGPLAGQSIGTSGPVLTVPGSSTVILAGISYQANDQNGLVFRTGPATLSLDGSTLSFALTGPGAAGASVIATIAAVPDGYVLNWTIATASPANWNIYTSGFTLSLPQTPTAARLAKAVKWTAPTGAQSWENPGDTPYPDTEFQVRQMDLLGSTVAWLSSYYDPNWFSGQNLASTPFSVFTPSFSSPGVASVQMGLFAVGATRQNPVQRAAEAAGRPLGLTLTTPNAGNLFEPGDQVPLSATVYNVTGQSLQATQSIQVWDYSGTEITQLTPTTTFGAGATQSFAIPFTVNSRGVVFVAGALTSTAGTVLCRATIGVLPVRPASPPIPNSVFGISSAPALPSIYPDQFSMPTMLSMMQRIGIRRARSNWFDLIDNSL